MKKNPSPVAVTSRSFSKHPILRAELLAKYEHVTFNDAGKSLAGPDLVSFLASHVKAIIALERINAEILAQLPELKVIAKYGVGIDALDLDAMKRFGVELGWTPGVNRRSVAELALTFMIATLRQVTVANFEVRSGTWRQVVGSELSGKTVGIIGCGHVGRELVGLLAPFQCQTLIHDILDMSGYCTEQNLVQVSLEQLLTESDVVSLHVPLNSSSRQLLNRERLASMKPTAILLNTARGGLVDENAMKEALLAGKLAGAAFDVFEIEPPEDTELIALPNFLTTGHIGGSSREAILAMGRAAIAGLDNAFGADRFL